MDIKGKGSMFTYWLEADAGRMFTNWLEADAANTRVSIQEIDTGDRYRESIPVSTEQWDSLWVAPTDLLATIESGIALNL